MASVVVKTRKLTRNKLATFLSNQELIKAFENLTEDVSTTIPGAMDGNTGATESAQETADLALALANAAQAIAAQAVLTAATVLNDGPPPVPFVSEPVDDITAQLAALREEVAALRNLINDRFTGPTP